MAAKTGYAEIVALLIGADASVQAKDCKKVCVVCDGRMCPLAPSHASSRLNLVFVADVLEGKGASLMPVPVNLLRRQAQA